jgi:hypothetical protein
VLVVGLELLLVDIDSVAIVFIPCRSGDDDDDDNEDTSCTLPYGLCLAKLLLDVERP